MAALPSLQTPSTHDYASPAPPLLHVILGFPSPCVLTAPKPKPKPGPKPEPEPDAVHSEFAIWLGACRLTNTGHPDRLALCPQTRSLRPPDAGAAKTAQGRGVRHDVAQRFCCECECSGRKGGQGGRHGCLDSSYCLLCPGGQSSRYATKSCITAHFYLFPFKVISVVEVGRYTCQVCSSDVGLDRGHRSKVMTRRPSPLCSLARRPGVTVRHLSTDGAAASTETKTLASREGARVPYASTKGEAGLFIRVCTNEAAQYA